MQYDSKRIVILSGKQYVQTNEKKEKGISTETAKQLLLHERRNSRINIELTDPEADVTFSRMRQKEVYNEDDGHDNLSIVFNMHDRLLWKNDV